MVHCIAALCMYCMCPVPEDTVYLNSLTNHHFSSCPGPRYTGPWYNISLTFSCTMHWYMELSYTRSQSTVPRWFNNYNPLHLDICKTETTLQFDVSSAITFLEYWKRKNASLAHHWDCLDFADEEVGGCCGSQCRVMWAIVHVYNWIAR